MNERELADLIARLRTIVSGALDVEVSYEAEVAKRVDSGFLVCKPTNQITVTIKVWR